MTIQNPPSWMPAKLLDWNSQSMLLQHNLTRMQGALAALHELGVSNEFADLKHEIDNLQAVVADNWALKSKVLNVFAFFGMRPEEYGFDPWPFEYVHDEWAKNLAAAPAVVIAALAAVAGAVVLDRYLARNASAATSAARFNDIYTAVFDRLITAGASEQAAADAAESAATGAAKIHKTSSGLGAGLLLAASIAAAVWMRG